MLEYVVIKTSVAMEVGIQGAILLQNIRYWIEKNKANGVNFHNGRFWTYNSVKAFVALFPFFSTQALRTAINRLKKDGYILVDNFNEQKQDRTSWYTLTDKGIALTNKCICENQQMQIAKSTNAFVENNKSTIKQNNTTKEYQKESRAKAPEDCPPKLAEAMNNFAKMRTAMKKPMTDRAKELLLKKLEKLAGSDDDLKIAILDQSIENSWTGIYPLKERRQSNKSAPNGVDELYNDGLDALKRMGLIENDGTE